MSNQTIEAAKQVNFTNKQQSSQALLIQQYANSVKEQPSVDFSAFKTLQKYQTAINTGLAAARQHADTFLNGIQPRILTNITNIGNYYALHNAVLTTLPPGSSQQEWVSNLSLLKTQSSKYQDEAKSILAFLQGLHDSLTIDAASFAKVVTDLNAAVKGDNGVLNSIQNELGSIQSKIDGSIAGVVLSALAIIGGTLVTASGIVTDVLTSGTGVAIGTTLIVGGIAIVAVGIGGEVASAELLSEFNNDKAKLLQETSTLSAEVKLAAGISSGYQSLGTQIKAAVNAASAMENAWGFLGDDLSNLANDLDRGLKNTTEVRTLFLTAANTEVANVIKDIATIKAQMAGVKRVPVLPDQTVGDAIVAAAKLAA